MKNKVQHLRESLVNEQVNKESRETSFAMFPIRLETKFMARRCKDKSCFDETFLFFKRINELTNELLFYRILQNFQDKKVEVPGDKKVQNDHKLPDEGENSDFSTMETMLDKKTYVKKFYELSNLVGSFDGIYNEDKSVIMEICDLFKFTKGIFPDEMRNAILPYLESMCKYASEIPVVKSISSDRGTIFLNKLEKVASRLETLSLFYKMPYRGFHKLDKKKGNVKMINYIEKHISECNAFFSTMESEIKRIPSMTANQRTKLYRYFKSKGKYAEEYHHNITKCCSSIPLMGLFYGFDKANWKEFKNNIFNNKIVCPLSYTDVVNLVRPKALRSLRYTEIIPFLIRAKMEAIHSLTYVQDKFSVGESNIKKINKLALESVFEYATEKKLVEQMINEVNCLIGLRPTPENISSQKSLIDFLNVFQKGKPIPEIMKVEGKKRLELSNLNMFDAFILNDCPENRIKETKCLCVRIFPDEIGINQFSEQLTKEEEKDGQQFWKTWYSDGITKEKQKEAWMWLCDKYESYRAGWISRKMAPSITIGAVNMDEHTAQMLELVNSLSYRDPNWKINLKKILDLLLQISHLEKNKVSVIQEKMKLFPSETSELILDRLSRITVDTHEKELHFPLIPESDYRDPKDLSKPISLVLPDRFIFIGKIKGKGSKSRKMIRFGKRIFPELQVGIHLTENEDIDPFLVNREEGTMTINSGMRWMTDYDEAEKMGMAITVPLSSLEYIDFESIYVVGVKDTDTRKSSEILNELFTGHYYSEEGLNLLKVGTPTNIVDDSEKNTYDTSERKLSDSHYKQDVEAAYGSNNYVNSDAYRISKIFNLDDSNPWIRVPDCANQEIEKSLEVNRVLAKTLISDKKSFFSYIFNTHIANDLSSRGVFPQMRIGSQPYGIVPVTDFSRFKIKYGEWSIHKLSELLLLLTQKWNEIVSQSVLYEGNLASCNAAGDSLYLQNYIKMLSCTPVSTSFYSRKYIKCPMLDPAFFRGFSDNVEGGVKAFEKNLANLFNFVIKEREGLSLQDVLPQLENVPLKDENEVSEVKNPWENLIKKIPQSDLEYLNTKFGIETDELYQLIAEFFDLFTYRLDAWMTSLLNYTLRKRIENKTHKLRIGAFGWVFDLKPQAERGTKNEFILAPSINHAITGAILRSSFNHAKREVDGVEQTDYHLSVNLSSVRVREALRIIDGVNNGLSLGAILGSDLERYLHDSHLTSPNLELDKFIYPLREKYPLVADKKNASNVKANNEISVINGEALLYDLREVIFNNNTKQLFDLVYGSENMREIFAKWFRAIYGDKFSDISSPEVQCFVKQMQHMEDSYDALSDVILSESVYKLTEGNREVVDSLMNCVEQGKNIPRPDVVNIPLHGVHVEQRMIAALDTKAVATDANSFIQIAEPSIDEWVGKMLGDFIGVMVGSEMINITPCELIYLSEDEELFTQYLKLRTKDMSNWNSLTIDKIVFVTDRQRVMLPLAEVQLVISSLREQLASCRMLKPSDLTSESISDDDASYNLDEISNRYFAVEGKMESLKDEIFKLKEKLNQYDDPMTIPDEILDECMNLLAKAFRAGIIHSLDHVEKESCFIDVTADVNTANLRKDAVNKLLDAITFAGSQCLERLLQAKAKIEDKNVADDVSKYVEAIQILLLKSIKIVPKFKTENTHINVEELSQQLASEAPFNNVNNMVLESWLIDVAKVRKPMYCFLQERMFGDWNDISCLPSLKVMQTPNALSNNEWIGSTVTDEAYLDDRCSFIVSDSEKMFAENEAGVYNLCGLVLDFWVERIPYKTQTAGLAFSYDQPDAEAPNAILMAVAPNVTNKYRKKIIGNWSSLDLVTTIQSAMHLVKSRGVEPDDIYNNKFTSAYLPLLNYSPDDEQPTKQ